MCYVFRRCLVASESIPPAPIFQHAGCCGVASPVQADTLRDVCGGGQIQVSYYSDREDGQRDHHLVRPLKLIGHNDGH